MRPARFALLPIVAAVVVLAGCASVGPRADAAKPIDAAQLAGVGAAATPAVDDRWWRAFGDAQLDALVDEALRGAPALAQAEARVRSAQALAEAAGAARYPSVNASADLSRQRLSERGLVPPPFGGMTINQGQFGVSLGYELDFFGRNRATIAAARSQADAAQLEGEAARLALTSSVARAYVQLDRAYRLLDNAKDSLAARRAVLDLTTQRVRAGLDTQVEVETARGGVAQAEGDIAQVEEGLKLVGHQLAALVGAGPGRADSLERPKLTDFALAVPEQLPADLVARRPDVAAQRARVTAAAADVRVARTQFYPNVNLAAFVGWQSIDLGELVSGGTRIWNVAPALRLPLFEGGRLRGTLRARDAQYDAAVAGYDQAVLDAFREVADAVTSLRALDREQDANRAALASLQKAFDLATLRYKSGLANYLAVLVAQDKLLAQRRLVVELDSRRADLTVALHRALGGGFGA
jgi:NodT family efflux transporter outer membrane factor (OMF) lipoprotein